jgi:hypothetical protein
MKEAIPLVLLEKGSNHTSFMVEKRSIEPIYGRRQLPLVLLKRGSQSQ